MYKEGREERRVGGMGEKKGREEGETGRGGGEMAERMNGMQSVNSMHTPTVYVSVLRGHQ